MRAVVPVESGGRVVALVSVGITLERIQDALADRLPPIGLAAAAILATGLLGAWLISRRLQRQTHGLGEREITRMYEYYEAVLHAVREGLLLVDGEGRVQLLNEEAERLLGLDDSAVGRPVADLGFPESLTRAVLSSTRRPDEIHLVDDAVLVVNTSPAHWQGREVGSVVTLRDHTEIQAVAGELDTVRGLAESLRSQNHEAANRLHTVVSLVELGRTEEALDFATEELEVAQLLTDRVVASVSDPVVSALLLGKTAQAAERGRAAAARRQHRGHRAADRAAGRGDDPRQPARQRHRRRRRDGRGCRPDGRGADDRLRRRPCGSRVGDSGSGLSAEQVTQVFERGWSTKAADGPVGRGLGLALVVQAVRKYDGHIDVGTSPLGGAEFDVRIGRGGVSAGPVRVLVVEDDELSAQAHADYVRRTAGFALVAVARSAGEALRVLRADRAVDLVLLDMHLPDGHGLGLLQTVRADGHPCDVIAVTAARDVDVVKRAVSQGVVLVPPQAVHLRGVPQQARAVRRLPPAPRRQRQRGRAGGGGPDARRAAHPVAGRPPQGHERRHPARHHRRAAGQPGARSASEVGDVGGRVAGDRAQVPRVPRRRADGAARRPVRRQRPPRGGVPLGRRPGPAGGRSRHLPHGSSAGGQRVRSVRAASQRGRPGEHHADQRDRRHHEQRRLHAEEAAEHPGQERPAGPPHAPREHPAGGVDPAEQVVRRHLLAVGDRVDHHHRVGHAPRQQGQRAEPPGVPHRRDDARGRRTPGARRA